AAVDRRTRRARGTARHPRSRRRTSPGSDRAGPGPAAPRSRRQRRRRPVADLPETEAVRGRDATRDRAVRPPAGRGDVARAKLPDGDVAERPHDRAHNPPAERVGEDLVHEDAVALVVPPRGEDASHVQRTRRTLPAEASEVVLAEERVGCEPHAREVEPLRYP